MQFLLENQKKKSIEIDNIYLWGSPVTEWTYNIIKENKNIFQCVNNKVIMGYSNNDKTQVFDFTQSLFNWPFRLLFSIRHSLPWQDNKKIININFSDTNFNHNQPHYHYIENIEEQEKKNNFQNIKIENNKIIEDTNEINKSHFLFHHFGKIEKLIFIFFILYKLKKTKYINSYFEKYINPYFEKIKKFMKSIV